LREDVGFVPFGGYLKEEENKLREEAVIRFEDWQKSLSERGISSKVVVSVGETVHEILKTAEAEKVDLIIIGRKKRVGGTASFIGSHAHKIITRSKFPTLVSKYMVEFDWDEATLTQVNKAPFETPLLGVDWSERTGRALDLLISLKGVVRNVFLFFNIDEKTLEKSSEAEVMTLKKDIEEKLDEYRNRLKRGGIEAEPHIGAGGMLDELMRISRERNASMIIVGNTSKDRWLSNILDRSLSYQITKMSELPTLLVP
jgi:nucleotide-binding universal stress UspA family protein